MAMENLVCKHLVLSPSYPQNSQEFKEVWVNEFVDWIRNNSTFHSIFLEHPDTNAHLDCLVWFPKKVRWDNFSRGLKKIVKKFIDANPASEFQNFYHVSKIPKTEEDILYLVGYNQKELRGTFNIPEELKERGIDYYEENQKTKKLRKFMNTNPLTPKNVVCYLLEQSSELNIQDPPRLIKKMIVSGFSFVPLSKQAMRKAILEFKLRTTGNFEKHEEFELEQQNGCHLEYSDYFEANCLLNTAREIIAKSKSVEEKYEELYQLLH